MMNPNNQSTAHYSAQHVLARLKSPERSCSPSHSNGETGCIRILLVASEQQVRICITQILTSEGFDVVTATGGTDAILLYNQAAYPLVITDIALSDMTGIELLKALKDMDEDAQVIVTTNYASLDSVLAALRAGAYDYLVKPEESPFLLLTTARRAMDRIDLLRENARLIHQLETKTRALEQANAMLHNFAINDGLTGLYNRRHFQDCLVAEIHRCERYEDFFALLFLDLDHFKIYNDINGHLQGDYLLQTLAQLFGQAFRKTDTVARYGGDEFAVILPKTTIAQALRLAENVSRRVAEYPFDGVDRMPAKKITISVGCAAYPHDGTTDEELLRSADEMLYKIKDSARGRMA